MNEETPDEHFSESRLETESERRVEPRETKEITFGKMPTNGNALRPSQSMARSREAQVSFRFEILETKEIASGKRRTNGDYLKPNQSMAHGREARASRLLLPSFALSTILVFGLIAVPFVSGTVAGHFIGLAPALTGLVLAALLLLTCALYLYIYYKARPDK